MKKLDVEKLIKRLERKHKKELEKEYIKGWNEAMAYKKTLIK